MTVSGHLRGIVIAGALAALALGLGFFTLSMNRTAAPAAPHTVLPLKLRHHALAKAKPPTAMKHTVAKHAVAKHPIVKHPVVKRTVVKHAVVKHTVVKHTVVKHTVVKHTVAKSASHAKPTAKPKKPRVDPRFAAAKKAGLPASIAHALASRRVVVVAMTSKDDPVAALAAAEAKTGAALAGAAFVAVNVDRDGGAVETLTRLLGALPSSPAALVYTRPAVLVTTLVGFNDRTVVQQAAASAATATPAPAR